MSPWKVTVWYDPGVPKVYYVNSAPTQYDAKDIVLREIGYNPGVPISVSEWDYNKCRCENNGDYCDYCLPFHDFDSLNWKPLTKEEKDMIRYND